MDLVVGHDMTSRGDDALRVALETSDAGGGLSIGVVHVLTQQDLDRTGELSAGEKRRAGVERAFPTVWRRLEEVFEAAGRELDDVSIDVLVRVAAVHLTRSQERIAHELLQTCVDHGATRIVLGRRGRPDGVADHVISRGEVVPASATEAAAHPHVVVVEVVPTGLDLPPGEIVSSGPKR